MKKTLRDVVPQEFFAEYMDTKAAKHLDIEVIATCDSRDKRWPGKQKNVIKWWVLKTGHAIGWNENVSIGWSFPVIKYNI